MFWAIFVIQVPTLCTLITLLNAAANNKKIDILFLQRSAVPSAESYARMKTDLPVLKDFSVGYWLKLQRYREESTLMSYAISDSKDNELRMDHRHTGLKISLHAVWVKTTLVTPIGVWFYYAITYNYYSSTIKIYENGELVTEKRMPKFERVLEGGGAYVIGQEQDSFGGNFQRDQSFSGEITELNFWDIVLTQNQIKQAISNTLNLTPALAWDDTEWNIHGEAEWVSADTSIFFEGTHHFVFYGTRMNFEQAKAICKITNGRIAVPKTIEENNQLYNTSVPRAGYCSGYRGISYLWLGATDKKEERVWRYIDSTEALSWEGPWRGSGPNGGIVENCLVMLYGDEFSSRWSDIACLETYYFCYACEYEDRTYFNLKGPVVCSASPLNSKYFIQGQRNGKPLIVGTFHTEMFWNNKTNHWALKSLKDNEEKMYMDEVQQDAYPFGKRNWVLKVDMCGLLKGDTVLLSFSTCSDQEFTCSNGACISLLQRCNLIVDCPDQSDETGCSLIDFPNSYKKIMPPPPLKKNEALGLKLYIDIITILSIDAQESVFQTTFKLSIRWKDVRLNFKNLQTDRTLNILTESEQAEIWTPKIWFQNAFGNIFTRLDEGAKIECISHKNGTPGFRDQKEEKMVFNGIDTSLEMVQYYRATYSCDFDLIMFPFNAQGCAMNFTIVSASNRYLKLKPKEIQYSGQRYLIEYVIGKLRLKTTTLGNYSTAAIELFFIQRFNFYLLTLFLPSALLVMIAYATFYFDPNDFNSRIVVALTAMLVLSSLFTQTSNSLAKTSYFKLVDVWLFFSILMIFFIIMFQSVAEYFSYKNDFKNEPTPVIKVRVDMANFNPKKAWKNPPESKTYFGYPPHIAIIYAGRIFIPLLYLVFNASYWGAAIQNLSEDVWTHMEEEP